MAAQTVLCTFHCNVAILFLSPQELQLLIFRADGCSSAVISLPSLWGSQLPVYLLSAVTSLPSLRGSQLPFFHAHRCSSSVTWLVFHWQFEQRAWHDPSPSAFSTFALLLQCLCRMSSPLSFVPAPLPVFLLLRGFESSSRSALCVHVQYK